MLMPSAETTCG